MRVAPNAPAEARCKASPPAGGSALCLPCATPTVEAATATKPAAQAAVLCQQCAIEQRRLADWDAHHYGTRGPCEACGREVLCAMVPPQPEARAVLDGKANMEVDRDE